MNKKISYERRDYQSVDEKSLSKVMSRKTTKKNSGSKGLTCWEKGGLVPNRTAGEKMPCFSKFY